MQIGFESQRNHEKDVRLRCVLKVFFTEKMLKFEKFMKQ